MPNGKQNTSITPFTAFQSNIGSTRNDEDVETIVSITGVPAEKARRTLKLYNNNVERAINILMDEGGQDSDVASISSLPALEPPTVTIGDRTPSRPHNNSLIDLTGDDDPELNKALEESLKTSSNIENQLVPSQRASDPSWAVVPTNKPTSDDSMVVSQEDHNLDQAIQASLQTTYRDHAEEEYEVLPAERNFRDKQTPMALRSPKAEWAYACLLLQCLFHVPQLRDRVANWRPPVDAGDVFQLKEGSEDDRVYGLMELFNMCEHFLLAELDPTSALNRLVIPMASPTGDVGDISKDVIVNLARLAEDHLLDQSTADPHPTRLFHFTFGPASGDAPVVEESVVRIEVDRIARPTLQPLLNDETLENNNHSLEDCLVSLMGQEPLESPEAGLIFDSCDIAIFQLDHCNSIGPRHQKPQSKPITFPRSLFLDRFLAQNKIINERIRQDQRYMKEEIQKLAARRDRLTRFEGKDVQGDIRSSLYYYEHVAEANGDQARQSTILQTIDKLKKIIEHLQSQVQNIEIQIKHLNEAAGTLYDRPDLQKHRYDLRAVLVHDGLPGRKHLYSYVQNRAGWWKTIDGTVEKVAEDAVLQDQTGFHLGAGPYMLFYSRAVDEEALAYNWPEFLKDIAAANEHYRKVRSEQPEATSALASMPPHPLSDDGMDISSQ